MSEHWKTDKCICNFNLNNTCNKVDKNELFQINLIKIIIYSILEILITQICKYQIQLFFKKMISYNIEKYLYKYHIT